VSKDSADTNTQKHAGGRPTDYYPEICDELPSMFEEGQSVVEVAVELGVARSTIYLWAKEHPEFSDALTRAREVSQAWWERQGRENLFDHEEYDAESKISTKNKFNNGLWKENMCKRFTDWRDRQEITGKDGEPLTVRILKASEADQEPKNDA